MADELPCGGKNGRGGSNITVMRSGVIYAVPIVEEKDCEAPRAKAAVPQEAAEPIPLERCMEACGAKVYLVENGRSPQFVSGQRMDEQVKHERRELAYQALLDDVASSTYKVVGVDCEGTDDNRWTDVPNGGGCMMVQLATKNVVVVEALTSTRSGRNPDKRTQAGLSDQLRGILQDPDITKAFCDSAGDCKSLNCEMDDAADTGRGRGIVNSTVDVQPMARVLVGGGAKKKMGLSAIAGLVAGVALTKQSFKKNRWWKLSSAKAMVNAQGFVNYAAADAWGTWLCYVGFAIYAETGRTMVDGAYAKRCATGAEKVAVSAFSFARYQCRNEGEWLEALCEANKREEAAEKGKAVAGMSDLERLVLSIKQLPQDESRKPALLLLDFNSNNLQCYVTKEEPWDDDNFRKEFLYTRAEETDEASLNVDRYCSKQDLAGKLSNPMLRALVLTDEWAEPNNPGFLPHAEAIASFYRRGGFVIFCSICGLPDAPRIINMHFGTNWNFVRGALDDHVSRDYVTTQAGRQLLGKGVTGIRDYSCNLIHAPEEDRLLIPRLFSSEECPLAVHVNENGGSVAYVGLLGGGPMGLDLAEVGVCAKLVKALVTGQKN